MGPRSKLTKNFKMTTAEHGTKTGAPKPALAPAPQCYQASVEAQEDALPTLLSTYYVPAAASRLKKEQDRGPDSPWP